VSPSDSLAAFAAHADLIPAFAHGLKGVARSMPTSGAVDRVAAARHIPPYETPTGWKYFGALLDAGLVNLCGEESTGTGADHLREKDGIWAVLFLLSIIAETGKYVTDIMTDHWATYGRNYYSRHHYENVPSADATAMITALEDQCASLVGQTFARLRVTQADAFTYTDPIDGRASQGHGHRILFEGGARAVFRLSGTGTQGATVRAYFERYAPADTALDLPPKPR
jgi:phosphoglucomutase